MSSIFIPDRHIVQPQDRAEIDYGNPLAIGLVGAINAGAITPDVLRVGAPAVSATSRGMAHAGNGTSMYYQRIAGIGQNATVLLVSNLIVDASINYSGGLGTSGAGSQVFGLIGGTGGSQIPACATRTTNGGAVFWNYASASVSTAFPDLDVWVMTWDGVANVSTLDRNGQSATVSTAAGATGSFVDIDYLCLGGINRGTDAFAKSGQRGLLAVAWNRTLSEPERREVSANPWQLFRASPRRLYFDVPAAGGTTLVIADATHGHTADGIMLTTTSVLAVADATHAHTSDNLTLTPVAGGITLVIQDAEHNHTADSLSLTLSTGLIIHDCFHAHTTRLVSSGFGVRKQTRNHVGIRLLPDGATLEEFIASCRKSIEFIHRDLDELTTDSQQRWEEMVVISTWEAVEGERTIAARRQSNDTAILRGVLLQSSSGNVNADICILPPALRPKFVTRTLCHGENSSTYIPVVLTIYTDGAIVPTWTTSGDGNHYLYLDNALFRLD